MCIMYSDGQKSCTFDTGHEKIDLFGVQNIIMHKLS